MLYSRKIAHFSKWCRRDGALGMIAAIVVTLFVFFPLSTLQSAELKSPGLTTNQAWIENQSAGVNREIKNVDDAFEYVFSQLPERVFVYPTENYYYYTFPADGVIYAGNLRLAAQDRDNGILHVAAFRQANQANRTGEMMYRAMSADDGVHVKKLNPFSYAVTFLDKTVVFDLNDVSDATPPKEIVAEHEEYLGLAADESGLRFFLFYNRKHQLFTYVLDETGPVLDKFLPSEVGERITIGARTGFAFYDHHYLDRRVLIGVHGRNTIVNNYFDGPADQLPENHIKDDNLRKSIEHYDPSLKGQLDPFGYFKTGEGRYLIAPYSQYEWQDELAGYDQCAGDASLPKELYDGCFYSGD